jgi:GTPase SAR1 family protein
MNIVILGRSSSGKTNLVAQAFLNTPPLGWRVQPSEEALAYVSTLNESISVQQVFPPGTMARAAVDFILIDTSNNQEFAIKVHDRPGSETEVIDERSRDLLKSADGFVIIVDHSRSSDMVNELRLALFAIENIRRAETGGTVPTDPRPAAICVSKCDLLIGSAEEYQDALESAEEFIRRKLGKELVEVSRRHFSRTCFFLVSAVGLELRFGVAEPTTFLDEDLRLRITKARRPINVLEPFLWLCSTLQGGSQ